MKYLILILTMVTITQTTFAQGPKGKRGDKLEAHRIAFITSNLDLSVEEAQLFWPVFNEFHSQMKDLQNDEDLDKSIDNLTDQEAREILAKRMAVKEKEHTIHMEFMQKLDGILSPQKQLKLFTIEREFKKSLLRGYKNKMKGRKGYPKREKK